VRIALLIAVAFHTNEKINKTINQYLGVSKNINTNVYVT